MVWQLAGNEAGTRLLQSQETDGWRAITEVCMSRPSTWERHPWLPALYRREGETTRIFLFESDVELDGLLREHHLAGKIPVRPVPPKARPHFEDLERA